jgi:RimJ/RimL family protein N-acetyltransferase
VLDFGQTPLLLVGQEVTLAPLGLEHVEPLARAAGESRAQYHFSPVPDGLEQTQAYVEMALSQRAEGLRFAFAIQFGARIVGTTSYSDYQPWAWPPGSALQRVDRPDAVEIGYTWLSASAQRTRCNTEAKLLLLRHAFESWDVHRVALRTDERNQRSRAAIARLGAQFEGIRRAEKPGADGSVRSSAFFSIVRAEWPVVREHLQGLLSR